MESLAYAVGVDRSTVVRWESGRSEPQFRHRQRLADALGVTVERVDALVAGDRPPAGVDAGRIGYLLEHPRRVDLVAVAELREQVRQLGARYESTPSAQLVGRAGECLANVMMLRKHAVGRLVRELMVAEAEAATLMGQLVWDASQRREQAAPRSYFRQAQAAAREVGDPASEGMAVLRESFVSLYGNRDSRAGLALAGRAAEVGGSGSEVVAGLGLLHVAEAHAMMGDRRACEQVLSAAEPHLSRVNGSDPAGEMFSPAQPGRLEGSCYLFLGDTLRAQRVLEDVASGLPPGTKSRAIVLGNIGLARVRQSEVEGAAAALHEAMDVLEATRGGGGLNIVFDAGRELARWRDLAVVEEVHDRLLALMSVA